MKTFIITLCLFFSATHGFGAVTASVTSNPNGSYTYNYTVSNSGGTFAISQWSLEFGFDVGSVDWNQRDLANGGSVTVPLGSSATVFDDWEADTGFSLAGNAAQNFFAIGPFGEGDVQTGQTLIGFLFTSNLPPGTVGYRQFSALGQSSFGSTTGPIIPASIPEPGRTSQIFVAIGSMLMRRRRRISVNK